MSGLVNNLKMRRSPEGFDVAAFEKDIEEAYLAKRKTGTFTTKKTFSPSTIGYGHGNCPRYWYIAFEGAEFNDTFTAQSIANMENGTATHARLESIFKDTGKLKWSEVEITNVDPPIRGFIDAVFDFDGTEVIGEVKSAKQEFFDIKKANMNPSPNHLIQILIYMKLRKAKYGVVIYENKNTQELCLIPLQVSDEYIKIINDLFDWMRDVRKAWEDKTIPERAFTKSKPACKGCPVFDTCWNKIPEKGEIQIEAFVPPKQR